MSRKVRIDNPDLVPFALYELGGAGKFIDVEDIFLHCFKLAPERFRWRKHDLPNYKTLSKALRDFEGRRSNLMLKTEDGLSRQLSREGLDWVTDRLEAFRAVLATPGVNPPTRRREHKLLNEFANHPLVKQFEKGTPPALSKYAVADLLLCAPDSPIAIWRERLETLKSAAHVAGRPGVVEFLEFVSREHPDWFGGE